MAGQHVTPAAELSILDSQVIGVAVQPPALGGAHKIALFTAPFRCVIEKLTFRGETIDDGVSPTIKISKNTSGSTTNVDITSTINPKTSINTARDFTLVTANGVPSENIVEAGSTVFAVGAGLGGAMTDYNVTAVISRHIK